LAVPEHEPCQALKSPEIRQIRSFGGHGGGADSAQNCPPPDSGTLHDCPLSDKVGVGS
jgi:hypothetical protein